MAAVLTPIAHYADAAPLRLDDSPFLGSANVDLSSAVRAERLYLVQQELAELADDCGANGWDDAGARALCPSAATEAYYFLASLPAYLQLPDIAAEPDGSLGLEWVVPQHGRVAVSLDGKMQLSWAARFADGSTRRGRERFVQEAPTSVIQTIRDLFAGI